MRIHEVGCADSIVLSKFKFNCDEIDKSIPDPLPQNLNHFLMIVGKPGSSKTTLLLNLICKRGRMYNKKFDRVYLFSPSLGTIDDWPKIENFARQRRFSENQLGKLRGRNRKVGAPRPGAGWASVLSWPGELKCIGKAIAERMNFLAAGRWPALRAAPRR